MAMAPPQRNALLSLPTDVHSLPLHTIPQISLHERVFPAPELFVPREIAGKNQDRAVEILSDFKLPDSDMEDTGAQDAPQCPMVPDHSNLQVRYPQGNSQPYTNNVPNQMTALVVRASNSGFLMATLGMPNGQGHRYSNSEDLPDIANVTGTQNRSQGQLNLNVNGHSLHATPIVDGAQHPSKDQRAIITNIINMLKDITADALEYSAQSHRNSNKKIANSYRAGPVDNLPKPHQSLGNSHRKNLDMLVAPATHPQPSGDLWKVHNAHPGNEEAAYLQDQAASPLLFAESRETPQRLDWAAAIAEEPGRVIEMKLPFRRDANPDKRFKNQLLLTFQDPAHEAHKLFTQVFTKLKIAEHEEVWVNLAKDIIYFGPDSYILASGPWRPLKDGEPDQTAELQPKGNWNHWKGNPATGDRPLGEEEEECNNPFRSSDGYHPLLGDPMLEYQRNRIKNVAFHLEFWLETDERRSNGQSSLLRHFKGAKSFILAAGDVGERDRWDDVSGLMKDERGCLRRRMSYKPRIARNVERGGPLPPFHINTGEVRFLPGAIQTSIDCSQWDINLPPKTEMYAGPLPVTMCVTRGGIYLGHKNRFETKFCPPRIGDESTRKVKAVYDSKLSQGNLQYQVEWRGHHKLDKRWYPAHSGLFNSYQHVINKFHEDNPGRPSPQTRWARKNYKRKARAEGSPKGHGSQSPLNTPSAQRFSTDGDTTEPLPQPVPAKAQAQAPAPHPPSSKDTEFSDTIYVDGHFG